MLFQLTGQPAIVEILEYLSPESVIYVPYLTVIRPEQENLYAQAAAQGNKGSKNLKIHQNASHLSIEFILS